MSYFKEPIHITHREVYLPEDKIKVYTGRIRRTSELHVRLVTRKMWMDQEEFENYKNIWQQQNEHLSLDTSEGIRSFLQFLDNQNSKELEKENKVYQKTKRTNKKVQNKR